MALDGFRYAGSALILLVTAGSILASLGYLERERLLAPEYYVLMLLAVVGMLFMVNAAGPHRRLPRPGNNVRRGLRAGWLRPGQRLLGGGRRSSTS